MSAPCQEAQLDGNPARLKKVIRSRRDILALNTAVLCEGRVFGRARAGHRILDVPLANSSLLQYQHWMPPKPAMFEPTPPNGGADRGLIESLLESRRAPVRFIEWKVNDVDLSGLDLTECEFVRCGVARTKFTSCPLIEARFDACDLNNTIWDGARLGAAPFFDCKLTGALFRDVTALNLDFRRCLMVSAYLRGVSFRRKELEALNFQGADLAGCDFREAKFTDCVLRDANVTDAKFQDADLRGADLGALSLNEAHRFKGALISKQQAAELLRGLGLNVL